METMNMRELLEDPQEEKFITATVQVTLYQLGLGGCVVYVFFLAVNAASRFGTTGAIGIAHDVVLLAYSLGMVWILRRRTLNLRGLHALAFGFVLLGAANMLMSAWLFSDVHELSYLAFYLLGLGTVGTYVPGMLVVGIASSGSAVFIATKIGSGADVNWIATSSIAAFALAAAIFSGRRYSYFSLAQSRKDEARQRLDLTDAFARVEQELKERKRSEEARQGLEQQLMRMQKLDIIGSLAGGIAHDMNNALAAVICVAEVAAGEHPPGSPAAADFEHIHSAARQGAALTQNLLSFSRVGKQRHEPFEFNTCIREVVDLLRRTAPKGVRLELEMEQGCGSALGDPGLFGTVVMNVCINAVEATRERGTVSIKTHIQALTEGASVTAPAGDYLVLTVADDGVGIGEQDKARLFEPFYSTKGEHTAHAGLGLAMVYGAVRDHQGEVGIESERGVGTTVTIRLPVHSGAAQAVAPTHDLGGTLSGQRVLIVDDEPMLRRALQRTLQGAGAQCVAVDGGAEAVALFTRSASAFSTVVLDLAMPGMSGSECFHKLRDLRPGLPIVICSGYPKEQDVAALLEQGRTSFVAKPFDRGSIVDAIGSATREG